MSKKKKILITIFSTIILLSVFTVQGALVVINSLSGANAKFTQASVIWIAVILVVVICYYVKRSLSAIGISKITSQCGKSLLYFLPLILIALSNFVGGIEFGSTQIVLSNILFTLSIGFAEEICFRGVICRIWLSDDIKIAVLTSSCLFGLSHFLNIAGGASIIATILQICFAFVYGIVTALIFSRTNTIIPIVFLHALHDFCSFSSAEGSLYFNIILGAIQFTILALYALYLIKQSKRIYE